MSKLRLAVAIPAYGGQISAHQARMWLELGNTLGGSTERFELVGFDFYDVNGIDRARNQMLARAADLRADWLLMIDADTWVEPGELDRRGQTDAGFLLLRMISEADRAGAAVVVAPVVRRRVNVSAPNAGAPGIDPMVMLYRTDHAGWPHQLDVTGLKGMVPVDAAATAVFAVRMADVQEAAATFAFTDLSEDLEFCRQLHEHGCTILADLRVRTGHMSRSMPLYSTEA